MLARCFINKADVSLLEEALRSTISQHNLFTSFAFLRCHDIWQKINTARGIALDAQPSRLCCASCLELSFSFIGVLSSTLKEKQGPTGATESLVTCETWMGPCSWYIQESRAGASRYSRDYTKLKAMRSLPLQPMLSGTSFPLQSLMPQSPVWHDDMLDSNLLVWGLLQLIFLKIVMCTGDCASCHPRDEFQAVDKSWSLPELESSRLIAVFAVLRLHFQHCESLAKWNYVIVLTIVMAYLVECWSLKLRLIRTLAFFQNLQDCAFDCLYWVIS